MTKQVEKTDGQVDPALLERLVNDGKIDPALMKELVSESLAEMKAHISEMATDKPTQHVHGAIGSKSAAEVAETSLSLRRDSLSLGLQEDGPVDPDQPALDAICDGEPVYLIDPAVWGGSGESHYQTKSGHRLSESMFKTLCGAVPPVLGPDPLHEGVYLRRGMLPGQATISEMEHRQKVRAQQAADLKDVIERGKKSEAGQRAFDIYKWTHPY